MTLAEFYSALNILTGLFLAYCSLIAGRIAWRSGLHVRTRAILAALHLLITVNINGYVVVFFGVLFFGWSTVDIGPSVIRPMNAFMFFFIALTMLTYADIIRIRYTNGGLDWASIGRDE